MSKLHLILITLIIITVGAIFYLLQEDGESPEVPKKAKVVDSIFEDKRSDSKIDGSKEYVQGYIKLPDLTEGFERCLSRGYSEIQRKILQDSRNIFEEQNFDEGRFSWNKVIFVDEYGEKTKLFLSEDLNLIVSKELEDGSYKEVERVKLKSLDEMKEKLAEEQVLTNEYSQSFKKYDYEMELILSDGVMKWLKVKSPKKTVVCKP